MLSSCGEPESEYSPRQIEHFRCHKQGVLSNNCSFYLLMVKTTPLLSKCTYFWQMVSIHVYLMTR